MDSNQSSVNIWHYKPWWCQPWSIVLTSLVLIGGSWLVLHKIWISAIIAIPVLAWMGFFLFMYPKQMQAYLEEIEQDQ